MSIGPTFRRELTAEARGRRPYLIRSMAAGAVALFLGSREELAGTWSGAAALLPTQLGEAAARAFTAFAVVQLAAVLAMVPALVGGSVAEGSARGTLGLLLTTRLGSAGILGGTLAARLTMVGLPMLAGLPVLALFGMLGGVDPARVAGVYAATIAVAWSVAAPSILASAYARSAAGGVAGAYALTLAWAWLPIWLDRTISPRALPPSAWWLKGVARTVAWSSPLSMRDPFEDWATWSRWGPAAWLGKVAAMAALHVAFGLALFALAAWRLRPAYRARLDARRTGRRWRVGRLPGLRGRPLPPVGDDAIRWKERHAPESAGAGRLVTLLGLAVVARMTVGDLDGNLAHRQHAMDELFRHGMDLGPWGIHGHARNGMNYVLNEDAAILVGVAMMASALLAAAGVAGERGRGTWDALLALPVDRAAILRAKMLGAAWAARPLLGLAVFLYAMSMALTALHPVGFAMALGASAVFVWFAVALGTYISTRSRDAGRAMARTVLVLLTIELTPVALLAPFLGGFAASLLAAPRLLLELPMSRMRVMHFTQAIGMEPMVPIVVAGVVLGIVGAHALAAWLLTRGAARRIAREGE